MGWKHDRHKYALMQAYRAAKRHGKGHLFYRAPRDGFKESVLSVSLQDAPRYRYEEESETCFEYGFFELHLAEYQGISAREYADERYGRHIHSAYDCSGMWFTRWIDVHCNQLYLVVDEWDGKLYADCLVSFVHCMACDV